MNEITMCRGTVSTRSEERNSPAAGLVLSPAPGEFRVSLRAVRTSAQVLLRTDSNGYRLDASVEVERLSALFLVAGTRQFVTTEWMVDIPARGRQVH